MKRVFYLYGMHGLTGNACQKLENFINTDLNHSTLHWAEKVRIEALHSNHQVVKQDDNLTCLMFCISYIINYMSAL